ncbi:MAG: dephospho-CoA kinase [Alphaproteobacteria bacterium]|nr:dephospho-CoA kinase [Alphaproteobacteria bacterium]
MQVIGITGSAATGKSTSARLFAARGIPVFDVDEGVRKLYSGDGAAVLPVANAFTGVLEGKDIDRQRLREHLLSDPSAFNRLESIVHPLIEAEIHAFLNLCREKGEKNVVLDIPLLFETGYEVLCHFVVVTKAQASLQKARLQKREGISDLWITSLLKRQMSEKEKCRRADFLIDTTDSPEKMEQMITHILSVISGRDEIVSLR